METGPDYERSQNYLYENGTPRVFRQRVLPSLYYAQAARGVRAPNRGTLTTLTFRARASYRLWRHLNNSALPQSSSVLPSRTATASAVKYFALNIFREILLIFSSTLEVFTSFMLRLIYWLRENHMYPFFLWGCLYTGSKFVATTIYCLFFLLHSFG